MRPFEVCTKCHESGISAYLLLVIEVISSQKKQLRLSNKLTKNRILIYCHIQRWQAEIVLSELWPKVKAM
jgi:hypothetical protein